MRKGKVIVTMTIEQGDGDETSATHAAMFDDPEGAFPIDKLAQMLSDCAKAMSAPRLDLLLSRTIVESELLNRLPNSAASLVREAKRIVDFWDKYDRDRSPIGEKAERLGAYLRNGEGA